MSYEEPGRRRPPSINEQRARTRPIPSRNRPVAGNVGGFKLPQLPTNLPLNQLLIIGAVVVLIVIGMGVIFGGGGSSGSASITKPTAQQIPVGAGSSAANVAPTAAPVATTQKAKIVNIGGGVGSLRETPAFTAAVVGKAVKDGDDVTILGPEKKAENVAWRLILFGDTAGWVPSTNLALNK